MRADPESPQSQTSYRAARRTFIAACEKAHAETVARLHPSKGPDGKPLFMDCAAIGLRTAAKAVLAVGYDAAGSDMLIALLAQPVPPGAKLVLIHALDPAAFAEVAGNPDWPAAMLGVVATEELSRARHLAVLPLGRHDETLQNLLQARLPHATVTVLPPGASAGQAGRAIEAFFATP
ncbi:MAG TPA: DUF2817 domain-containing protein [Rhizomicrobium sp.]|nr:DUF2817 domain-containing protein [Rhizomicrobium sp.]